MLSTPARRVHCTGTQLSDIIFSYFVNTGKPYVGVLDMKESSY